MNTSLIRVAILLLMPLMGCSQNENITPPPDSIEVIPMKQVYDGDIPEDSLLYVSCSFVGDDAYYTTRALNIFYNDSMLTTIMPDGEVIHPRLCKEVLKLQYDRSKQTFIIWAQETYISADSKQLTIKVDHRKKVYLFDAVAHVKTYNGTIPLGMRSIYLGFLVPKLNPDYKIEYQFKEKLSNP